MNQSALASVQAWWSIVEGALMARWMGWVWVVAGLMVFSESTGLYADPAPPIRAARLTYLQGGVTVEQADNTGSDAAVLNMPLSGGVRVTTAESGEAEVEFEDGSLVRLTPNSSLELTKLSVDSSGTYQTEMSLLSGLAYAELRAATQYVYQLDAGGDVITPVQNATVRITMDEPPARIAALDGSVNVERTDLQGGYRTSLRAGETLQSDATDGTRYFLRMEIAEDSWDAWNQERDQAALDASASRTGARDGYAGGQGYGWSDLDANGSWYEVPGQGEVWQPSVAQDATFDPYGYGSWVWYPGAGYVWASGYSWGWTPFRCGSWSYWGGFGWGWAPGVGCGYGGWALGGSGFGGSYVVNVSQPPSGYHFLPLPGYGSGGEPGHVHPIVVVRPGRGPNQPTTVRRDGPVIIAGRPVRPLAPLGTGEVERNASAVGAGLRRDFPVDQTTRKPVMGVVQPVSRAGSGGGAGAVVGARVPGVVDRAGQAAAATREESSTGVRPRPAPQLQAAPRYSPAPERPGAESRAPQYSSPRYSSPPPTAAPRPAPSTPSTPAAAAAAPKAK